MNITLALSYTKQTRKNFIELLDSLSIEQLNHIPEGYNNNIIWNFGHNLTTMQILCYKLSGLPMNMEDELIDSFRKGSKPQDFYTPDFLKMLIHEALNQLDQFENDYKNGLFKSYNEYTTSYNVTLNNAEEAFVFNNIHEGLHFGYAMAMRKLV